MNFLMHHKILIRMMRMTRVDSVVSPSSTGTVEMTSRSLETKEITSLAIETTNPSEVNESLSKPAKVTGLARDATTAISPGEPNANVAMLVKMELKVLQPAGSHLVAIRNHLKHVKATGHVRDATTVISPGELSVNVAMLERMELKVLQLSETQEVDSVGDVEDVEPLVVDVELLVAVVVDSTNLSVDSTTKTSRQQTRKSSLTNKQANCF